MSENVKNLPFSNELTGSTRNVLLAVALGKVDAGATLSPSFEREPEDIRAQLRTILETEEIPSHPLSAHPRISEAIGAMIKQAVLDIAATPENAGLMRQIRLPAPTAADYVSDYKSLENVNVKHLSNWGE
ncbi:MAG: phosphate/phosphite/phosphonate ABC transporter substrate-binding protein [Proteobacteria bacterium]|nr:phosphate/phosphite/phosphonate ABC transporter substrate-binding protein [Pseudomonadota bacterium]MBU1737967.1 phosphate/phosphite/phosphonate ABC transporter substrate-binding protein [Pseudomonadota bacterium]